MNFRRLKNESSFFIRKLLTYNITHDNIIVYDNVTHKDNIRRLRMKPNTITVMMHPIRIRIIQELSIKKTATTKELQVACGDIAQATLYRHLKELLKYDLIQIVSENIVNGIIEKVYAINLDVTKELTSDPSKITIDTLTLVFNQFMMSIMTDFKVYIDHEEGLKNIQTEFSLITASLFLTDEELRNMMIEINKIVLSHVQNKPEEGRKLRKFSRILTTSK